ncbi:putative N6-adenine-specific DNA methylase [Silvimonas terrae]|uniref:Putative N6-adenine-specific DNA methylase n=1 Tax=Silvimonas terrae TaxID=300266 RepID=A0A840RIS7_9NEIS|nr:THUMP domain-containing protein [Silvimonas terrae]MBB5192494.1 putative N6-adenine-specific DNA methylase [Silvimonas terrae]
MSDKKTLKLPPKEAAQPAGNARRPSRPAGRAAAFSGGQAQKPYQQDPAWQGKSEGEGRGGARRDGADKPRYQGDRDNRSERPQGDRPAFRRDDRDAPRGDRPYAGDKPRYQGDRDNRGDRPQGDRPAFRRDDRDAPRGDRGFASDKPRYQGDRDNRSDRPQGDRPAFQRDDRNAPRGDRGYAGDKPRYQGDRDNRSERPQGDRPSWQRDDAPRADRGETGADRPRYQGERDNRADRPQGDRPAFRRDDRDAPRGDRGYAGDKPRYQGDRDNRADRPQGDRPAFRRDDRDAPRRNPDDRSFSGQAPRPRQDGDRPGFDRPRGEWQDRPQRDGRDAGSRERHDSFADRPRRQDERSERAPRRDGNEGGYQSRSHGHPAPGGGAARQTDAITRPLAFDWQAVLHFYTPCPRGLERSLADELEQLGAQAVLAGEGGVAFEGHVDLMYKVNLHSRFASRVLLRLDERAYRNEADLYRLATRIDWPSLFDVARTIKVNVTAQHSSLRSIDFVALKIKDAICDVFRTINDERPSVDTHDPDIRIQVFLTDRLATLYIDTSGEPLFKRGYRQESVEAPLRENLAAGLLALAGWRGDTAVFDPMCGSGTFLIEAAQMALNLAPGRLRQFGFEKLFSFDPQVWGQCKAQAEEAARTELAFPIVGSDRDVHAVDAAMRNIEAAGLTGKIKVQVGDVLLAQAPATEGLLISNPPYGVRLEEQEQLAVFYPQLGDALKQRFTGWNTYLLTADLRLPKLIRLNATKRIPVYNGALDCRLYEFKVVAGSNRQS